MPYKHDYDKTLRRLNTIIVRLNNGDSLSVKELAEEFNVSIRTIQKKQGQFPPLNSFQIFQDLSCLILFSSFLVPKLQLWDAYKHTNNTIKPIKKRA